MSAVISDCGKYRHHLIRQISEDNPKFLLFIMLNPSTADAEIDDPTIRKCKGFCERLGYGKLVVVNLFDWRATDPNELKKVWEPVSKHNMNIIRASAIMADKVICAWGTKGNFMGQDKAVLKLLEDNNITPYALDITKDGHPKHPLYISYDKKPVLFTKKEK